jgi:hypothetical protein
MKIKNKRILAAGFAITLLCTSGVRAQTNADPVTSLGAGAFTDFGYNPRAEAMGGAMVAVTTGEYQYAGYNPAMPSYQDGYRATVSYSVLNLDRSLNFVSIGGPLVNAVIDTTVPLEQRKPKGSTLRVQLGWLRAGVSNFGSVPNSGLGFPRDSIMLRCLIRTQAFQKSHQAVLDSILVRSISFEITLLWALQYSTSLQSITGIAVRSTVRQALLQQIISQSFFESGAP